MNERARYAELHARSNFSFLDAGSHPEELVDRAAELGIEALAIADADGLYGAVRFARRARERALPGIVGARLHLPGGIPVLLLVAEACGYHRLCELISGAQLRGSKGSPELIVADLEGDNRGLIALCGDLRAPFETLRTCFPDALYIEIVRHLHESDAPRNESLIAAARRLHVPYVASNDVAYARREDAEVAAVLRCIKHGVTLEEAVARKLLDSNSEAHLKSPRAMARLFADYPGALERTLDIAERARFRLETLSEQFPLFAVPDGCTRQSYLRALTMEGAAGRYGSPLSVAVERQLEYELGIIAKLDLAGYFLIVWDIVRAANEMGVLCQGRGSAANSAVCYALGITAVDPVGMDLLFERFLSEERNEIPDIDIDFAHRDRERIIQYIYERYGRAHAAMAAEVISYRSRSALRDIGKVLGVTPERAADDPAARDRLVRLCERIEGFPRHLGIHSGGMVLARDPLVRVAPVEWATMRDRSVIQWDKDDLAALGLIKIDLLGLGMLSLLDEAFALHRRSRPNEAPLSLAAIPPDDAATYAMLERADSIGVFQIESRAQQSMLPRMKPRCFYDLVMQVAIIRPGPIQGQMIHPFLRRRAGLEAVEYPHPKLRPVLERTLGVPLFQEQGMRLAVEAAGFSAGEADRLRRAMGHKRSREKMQALRTQLIEGMERNGIERDAAEKLFAMLEGFADYGFPESHAASFALLAYASAYLKCRYHAEFTAAILNVQPMGFYATEVLVNDAKRHDVVVKPVEVNASEWWSFVDGSGAVRLGFHLVRDLGSVQRECLEAALKAGAFADILDFARRTDLSREGLESLAVADAFAPWYRSRREAMWALRALDERERRGELGRLMETEEPAVTFAPLQPREQTAFDLWATGVTTGPQGIAHLRAGLDALGVLSATALAHAKHRQRVRVGGLVITRQRPGTAKGFVFLTLEDETGLVNVIVRPDLYERTSRIIATNATLIVAGTLQKESGCIDVLAAEIEPLESEKMLAGVRAHNFH
ncbi:MAG: error-prone DNA polymerase [Candidatus Eremiobacteraeota bacterium]|nr:error-prone DNA polymerase [Candidatus Eremiobacteraeota bacterium]